MGGCNQIDVMRSLCLQLQKDFPQPSCPDFQPRAFTAQRRVLAKDAAKSAVRKKHRPGTTAPRDAGFFPRVQRGPRYPHRFPGAAAAAFARRTVYPAATRAKGAMLQQSLHGSSSFFDRPPHCITLPRSLASVNSGGFRLGLSLHPLARRTPCKRERRRIVTIL